MLPDADSENFMDFTVTVDGEPVSPKLEARVIALGLDQTEVVRRLGLSLNPMDFDLYQWLQTAPPPEKEELNRLGLATVDPYTTQAVWKLETTFYWEQTFPPGKEVVVEHRYRPITGYGFFGDWVFNEPVYREKYCIDCRLRGGGAEEARGDQGHEQPLHERAAGELHPHHRQQLGDRDPGFQAGGRQGQPRRAGQLLRHGCEEDRADPVRDARQGLRPRARARDPDRRADRRRE